MALNKNNMIFFVIVIRWQNINIRKHQEEKMNFTLRGMS